MSTTPPPESSCDHSTSESLPFLPDIAEHRPSRPGASGPETELALGLQERTIWIGGNAGSSFVPNIPTEEVLCGPHRPKRGRCGDLDQALSLFGILVEDFCFRIADGRIVEATASRGQAVLDQLLDTDEGSERFGECAMVPMSSAVAAERLVWNNTL